MPALALSAWGLIRSLLGKLSFWQILLIAAVAVAGFQTLRLHGEQRHSAKLEQRVAELSDTLKSISTKRDEQKATTAKAIDTSDKSAAKADILARKIESAPTSPDCKTPPIIMGEDL